jgi:hypothetical protein
MVKCWFVWLIGLEIHENQTDQKDRPTRQTSLRALHEQGTPSRIALTHHSAE